MFQKTTLKNGLRIITAPMKGTKAVTVLVLVKMGSKYERKRENGISHFLEHMFFKGTKKRPTSFEITETIERVGGVQNASTGKDYTFFFATLRSKYLDLALDLISDILLNSKFDASEIEREKRVIIEEINLYLDTPTKYIGDLWEKLLYGDQPAGRLVIGEKENISKFKRGNFLEYLRGHYCTKNVVVSVAGKIDGKETVRKVREYFQGLRVCPPKKKEKVIEKQKKPEALLHFKKTDQTHLALGVRGFDLFSPRRYTQAVLGKILGGMMSSRLFMEIREREGLAYYINTTVEANPDTGYLVTLAGIDNKRVEKATKIILREYKKISESELSEKELKKAKENIKGKMTLKLESSAAQASFYGMQELLENRVLTPDQVFKKVDEITTEQIQELAKNIFVPKKLNLALIGPFKKKERFEKILKI